MAEVAEKVVDLRSWRARKRAGELIKSFKFCSQKRRRAGESAVSRLILYCKLGGIQQASFLPCATHLLYLLFSFLLLLPPNRNGERQHGLICPLGITRNKEQKLPFFRLFSSSFFLPPHPSSSHPPLPLLLLSPLSGGIILTLCAINDTRFPLFFLLASFTRPSL